MSYYDPLYPAYQATRFQIQKTILSLEQKLRKRKQIDLLVQKDILQKQVVQRQRDLISHDYLQRQYRAQNQLRQSLRRLKMFDPRPIVPTPSEILLEKQTLEFDYLQRLNLLRRQRQLLDRDLIFKQVQTKPPTKQRRLIQQDSDQILVRKYQDGSKLNEYNQQLKRSNQKPNGKQQFESSVKKYDKFSTYRQSSNKYQNDFQTPFDKLKHNQTSSQKFTQRIQPQPQYNSSKKKLYEDIVKKQRQTFNKKESGIEPTQPTQQLINGVPYPNKNISVSPSKSVNKRSRRSINRSVSARKLNKSAIKLDRSRAQTIEQSALKKIQNRLIVSNVIYEDSQYRNTKHEMNHLYSTYQNQLKIRKDIKDKINANPLILRKHAMVIQN